MARRSGNRTLNRSAGARSPYRSLVARPLLPAIVIRPLDLRVFEDRRTYHPDRLRPPLTVSRRDQRKLLDVATRGAVRSQPPLHRPARSVLSFAVPKKVLICMRRERRRETLFALGRTGRGARSVKRRNEWSAVSCRRR